MEISAVVVTYNRKDSLKTCLARIGDQTHKPDRIIVVDNASTDGTDALIRHEFPYVEYFALSKNLGGAGGYKAGIQHALITGSDAVWVMDDDAFAEPDCLSNLVIALRDLDFDVAGSLVVSVKDPNDLAFPLPFEGKLARKVKEIEDNYIQGIANLFNGVLIKQSVVSAIGLPDERLFIRGDEVDYFLRMKRAGLKIVTVRSSVVMHPSGLSEQIPLLFGRFIVTYTTSMTKNYCSFRNRAYINKKYNSYMSVFSDFVRYFIFFAFQFRVKGFALWWRATQDGLREKFINDF